MLQDPSSPGDLCLEIFYYRQNANFGDHLNSWLWPALVPGITTVDSRFTLCAIGTLLSDLMPRGRRWLVMGSGTGYSPPPDLTRSEWHFAAVRGPLTARAMGLPAQTAVTDAAILLAALPDGRGSPLPAERRSGVVFMPHWKQLRFGRWREACEAADVEFIDPLQDSRDTLARIRGARLVLADAMHAAICADSVRVPWVPLCISHENHSFKWIDWTASLELAYAPHVMPASTWLEKCQSALAVFAGTNYRLDDLSEQGALAFHAQTLQRRSSVGMAVRRRFATGALLLLAAALRLPGLGAWRRRRDRQQFEAAVQALRQAAAAPGCLSAQPVFEARLRTMQQRLEEGLRKASAG